MMLMLAMMMVMVVGERRRTTDSRSEWGVNLRLLTQSTGSSDKCGSAEGTRAAVWFGILTIPG